MSFWRPLAEFSHWIDYRLWPQSPLLMHAHSLLWYGALLLLLGHLYRRLMNTPLQSGLALAFFAVSSLHVMTISWLSARNQLMSAFFTVGTVYAYHLWRQQGRWPHAGLAMLTFVLALASAEASVTAVGYLLAYALTLDSDRPWRARLMPLLPFMLITAVWRVACTQAGYGSIGSGSYLDPTHEPLRFAQALFLRMPAMVLAQLFGMPSSAANELTQGEQVLYASVATLIAAGIVWLVHRMDLWSSRHMRFFALGMLLALVPVCAVAPQDRVLIHAEIGMSGLLSLLSARVLSRLDQDRRAVGTGIKWTVGVVMLVHLLLFPLASLLESALLGPLMGPSMYGAVRSLPVEAGRADARVILLNPPTPDLVFYYPLIRSYLGLPNPQSIIALANGPLQQLQLEVLDDSTLRLSSARPFEDAINRDVRTLPFKVGDVVHLRHMTITVEQVNAEGSPLAARFHFDAPLRDPHWQFYVWRDLSYARFDMPATGRVVTLPGASLDELVRQSLNAVWSRRRRG
jgi:hypothetical protein